MREVTWEHGEYSQAPSQQTSFQPLFPNVKEWIGVPLFSARALGVSFCLTYINQNGLPHAAIASRLESFAIRLEATALGLEAIAIRLESIAQSFIWKLKGDLRKLYGFLRELIFGTLRFSSETNVRKLRRVEEQHQTCTKKFLQIAKLAYIYIYCSRHKVRQ